LLSLMAFDFYKIANERLNRQGLDDARQGLYLFDFILTGMPFFLTLALVGRWRLPP
jgi:hypothetical protein